MIHSLFQFVAFWATLLLEGSEDLPINKKKAYKLAKIGSKFGCSDCTGVLARCYYNGYGCVENQILALQLAKASASSGSCFGFFVLAWKSYDDKEYENAAKLWQISADHGLAAAQVCLGYLYVNGEGVQKDEQKAFQLYNMAANQKHPEGYQNMSRMYEWGIGVKPDIDEASRYARLTRKAGISNWLLT
jgi:TPR repeat protein